LDETILKLKKGGCLEIDLVPNQLLAPVLRHCAYNCRKNVQGRQETQQKSLLIRRKMIDGNPQSWMWCKDLAAMF